MLKKIIQTTPDPVALVLRLALGIMIFPHGAQKLLGWFGGPGFAGTAQFMGQQLGIPVAFVALAVTAEFFGGLGLLTGLLTRVSALGVASVMAVAVAKVHLANGFFMNWYGTAPGEGFEFHLLAIGIAVALMIRGGGAFSLDGILTRRQQG